MNDIENTADILEEVTFPRKFIKFGYIWSITVIPFIFLLNLENPIGRAVTGMALGLILIWTIICGKIMYQYRNGVKHLISKIRYRKTVFVIFSTGLAMFEELITVTMTNTAGPIWGVSPKEAYITASTNYWEVVSQHSVIAFIPWIIAWAFILDRYRFNPLWVYVLFGFTGTLPESSSFGWDNLINIGFWTNVYGLMVFLPAYSFVFPDTAKTPPKFMYIGVILLELLAMFVISGIVIFVSLLI